jgi:hypothetical protein
MTTYSLQSFPYNQLTLGNPYALQGGGSYFTKLTANNKAIYIQFPLCMTKNGVVETKRNTYIDLMFERVEDSDLVNWIEQVEQKCQDLIDVKKQLWFSNEITREDLESMMSPISRNYKSGKKILIRVNLHMDKKTNQSVCRLYDENQNIKTLAELTNDVSIIPLLCLEGIKFTSRSFEIELSATQILFTTPPTFLATNPTTHNAQTNSPEPFLLIKKDHPSTIQNTPTPIQPQSLEKPELSTVVMNTNIQPIIKNETKEQNKEEIKNETQINTLEQKLKREIKKENTKDEQPQQSQSQPQPQPSVKKQVKEMEEVTLDDLMNNKEKDDEPIHLKNKKEVYYGIYKMALKKAKRMRRLAIQAYLEAKEIKSKYMIDDLDESDTDTDNEQYNHSDDEEDDTYSEEDT